MEFEHNHRTYRGTEEQAIREYSQNEQSGESVEYFLEPESELDFSS